MSATFITYHQLRVGADDALPASCPVTVREALRERGATQCGGAAALLPAFGLLALKLDAEQWLAGGEPRLVADLAAACASWMAPLAGKHSDFECVAGVAPAAKQHHAALLTRARAAAGFTARRAPPGLDSAARTPRGVLLRMRWSLALFCALPARRRARSRGRRLQVQPAAAEESSSAQA